MVGFFSRCCSGKGPHLALRGESPGFSRVATLKFVFLLSYNGNLRDLRDLHGLPQESSVSMWIARGHSRFLCSRCQVLCPHLELRPEPRCSSPLLTWISVFLWRFNRAVRPHLVWRHASSLSSLAVTVVSGFLSSWHRDLWLSLEVPQGYFCGLAPVDPGNSKWGWSQSQGKDYLIRNITEIRKK